MSQSTASNFIPRLQAAKILACHPRTISRLIARGLIHAVRPDARDARKVYVRRADVERLIVRDAGTFDAAVLPLVALDSEPHTVGTVAPNAENDPQGRFRLCALEPEKSFAADVIADMSGQWVGNGLRFATADEAGEYVRDLAWRWTLVRDVRVRETTDRITHRWATVNGSTIGALQDMRIAAPQTLEEPDAQ